MLTYVEEQRVYHADNCVPLAEAAAAGAVELRAQARDAYPGKRLDAPDMPELRTAGYWDATRPQGWGLDWHRNEGIEFTLLSRGRIEFAVDGGGAHRLEPGSFTITRPWQRHRLGQPNIGPSRLSWLILDVGVRRPNAPWRWPDWLVLGRTELERLAQLLQQNETPVWPADREVGEAFERLDAVVRGDGHPELTSRLKLAINELLLSTLGLLERQPMVLDPDLVSSRRTVTLFLELLGEQLERGWTVEDMARACGLGTTRFAHYCGQLTNATPMAYLNRLRIERARELIATRPELPLTAIGALCGFETSQYFSFRFKAETGQSPRAYRNGLTDRPPVRELAPHAASSQVRRMKDALSENSVS